MERAAADPDRVGDAVDAVDDDHGVGRLGGDGRAGRAHRDADVGERERGRVVDAVADHDHGAELGLRLHRAHDLELLLRRLLRVDVVDADLAADRVGDGGAVAGDERDVADAGRLRSRASGSARPARSRSPITTDADEPAVDLDEHLRVAARRRRAARSSQERAADRDAEAVDASGRCPCPTGLVHVSGKVSSRRRAAAPSRTSASASAWADSWSSEAASRSASSGGEAVERRRRARPRACRGSACRSCRAGRSSPRRAARSRRRP